MMKEVLISAVSFQEGALEIVFLEKNDNSSEFVAVYQTMAVDCRGLGLLQQYEEIHELLEEIVDAGLVARRNPPKQLGPGRSRHFSRSFDRTEADETED